MHIGRGGKGTAKVRPMTPSNVYGLEKTIMFLSNTKSRSVLDLDGVFGPPRLAGLIDDQNPFKGPIQGSPRRNGK